MYFGRAFIFDGIKRAEIGEEEELQKDKGHGDAYDKGLFLVCPEVVSEGQTLERDILAWSGWIRPRRLIRRCASKGSGR